MTERDTHFDSEVKKLVMKKNGGEVTPELFWSITAALGEDVSALIEAVRASNVAGEARHADTLEKLSVHEDADERHREDQAKLCAQHQARLLRRSPRRKDDAPDIHYGPEFRDWDDPSDAQFTEPRESAHPTDEAARSFAQILAAWSLGKKVLAIIGTVLITLIVGLVFSYCVAYFAADRAEKAGIEVEKTALPAPTVTVTATPIP